MSVPNRGSEDRGRVRWWPALAITVCAGVIVGALQFAPGERLPVQFRNFGSMLVGALAVLALWLWLALFSNLAPRRRMLLSALSLLGLAISIALVDHVEFTGDLEPHIVFRWERDPAAILQAHRDQVAREARSISVPTTSPENLDAQWSGFRGSDRSGIYRGKPIRSDWAEHPPELLWKQPIGEGYAQIALAGNLAVTIEQRGDREAVVCYDALTGAERWVHSYQTRFAETMGGDGPRATPTIDGGKVFALGATGWLKCLEADTGKVEWEANILKDVGSANLSWGMSGSPLVLRDLVIVSPGGPTGAIGKTVVAHSRHSGDVAWGIGSAAAGYSSPQVAEIDGVEQIVLFDGEGVAGYQSDGTAELWRYAWSTSAGINCSQPIVIGANRVLITAGYAMGSVLLEVTRHDDSSWQVRPVWEQTTLRGKFSTPVVFEGFVYGLDEGILVCIDLETGRRRWKQGRYGHGQILLAQDGLFIQAENGDLVIVAVDPDRHRELGRIPALEGRTWNGPALAAGRAFVRNHREMACFDLSR